MDLAHARAPLVAAVTLLERAGLIDFNGHASVRLAGGGLAINSGASNRAALGAGDITAADAAGETVPGLPAAPKERYLHAELYRARPDAGAIVHAHAPWGTMLSTARIAYEPVFPQGALLGEVPLFGEVASINAPELGAALAKTVGSGRAALLQNHGIVVCGATLEEAVVLALYLEENARRQVLARSVGGYRVLTRDEAAAAVENLTDAKLFRKAWEYYAAKAGVS